MNFNKKKILSIILVSILFGFFLSNNKYKISSFGKKVLKLSERSYNYTLKKIGLVDLERKVDLSTIINEKDDNYKTIKANSFSITYSKVKSFSDRTATILLEEASNNEVNYEIYTQNGLVIKNNTVSEIKSPSLFYSDTGIKSVFKVKKKYYAFGGFSTPVCSYASIFNANSGKIIYKSKCLPDKKNVDFDGLGGAYIKKGKNIILTVGTPVHSSKIISELAQSKKSVFGKIISFNEDELLDENVENFNYEIYSYGHRNPQGLVFYQNNIFSFEHGPQGGDEFNKIIKNKNYGWPITSFGTEYGDGQSYTKDLVKSNYEEPIYSYVPSVATSALNVCPKELENYYAPYGCLMGLSLKEKSILILILNKDYSRVIISEKIKIGGRLRSFGQNNLGNLFVDSKGYFYISIDKDGLYKAKFDKFRD
jgi:hypothetical protein